MIAIITLIFIFFNVFYEKCNSGANKKAKAVNN